MIIQEINATVNGNSLSGEVIVPSPVLTSTKQEENGDLTKSPNFQLKLTGVTPDMNIIDTIQVEFTNGDFNYTANMNVINKLQNGTVILQYVDGLTVEEAEEEGTYTVECNNISTNNLNYMWDDGQAAYICDPTTNFFDYGYTFNTKFYYNDQLILGENSGLFAFSLGLFEFDYWATVTNIINQTSDDFSIYSGQLNYRALTDYGEAINESATIECKFDKMKGNVIIDDVSGEGTFEDWLETVPAPFRSYVHLENQSEDSFYATVDSSIFDLWKDVITQFTVTVNQNACNTPYDYVFKDNNIYALAEPYTKDLGSGDVTLTDRVDYFNVNDYNFDGVEQEIFIECAGIMWDSVNERYEADPTAAAVGFYSTNFTNPDSTLYKSFTIVEPNAEFVQAILQVYEGTGIATYDNAANRLKFDGGNQKYNSHDLTAIVSQSGQNIPCTFKSIIMNVEKDPNWVPGAPD